MTNPDYRAELQLLFDAAKSCTDPALGHHQEWEAAMNRAHALLAQPEPFELTDEDLDAMERQCWIPTEAYNDDGCEYYASLRRFARAAISADRARRPTPHTFK